MAFTYLTVEDILAIHDAVLEASGGKSGIISPGIVESAIARPETYLSYNEDTDIYTYCSIILDTLARGHAFMDGNKRTSVMATLMSFELNTGKLLLGSPEANLAVEEIVLWVVTTKPTIDEIAKKFKQITADFS